MTLYAHTPPPSIPPSLNSMYDCNLGRLCHQAWHDSVLPIIVNYICLVSELPGVLVNCNLKDSCIKYTRLTHLEQQLCYKYNRFSFITSVHLHCSSTNLGAGKGPGLFPSPDLCCMGPCPHHNIHKPICY